MTQKNEHGTAESAEFAEGPCLDHLNLCGSLRSLRYKYHPCFHMVSGCWDPTVETVGYDGMSLRDKQERKPAFVANVRSSCLFRKGYFVLLTAFLVSTVQLCCFRSQSPASISQSPGTRYIIKER